MSKRKIRVTICIAMLLCGVLIFDSIISHNIVNAATQKNIVHSKYVSKIKAYKKRFCSEMLTLEPQVYFNYYDLNHDGIDECIIQGVTFSDGRNTINGCGGTDIAVYTYYKGKVKKVAYSLTGGGTWGGIYVIKNKEADICFYDRSGITYAEYVFKKLKKGKLEDVGEARMSASEDGDSSEYFVNGKKTIKKKYETYRNKMTGNFEDIKLYKATAKNLKNI